ncbi:MAG: family 43 glycosylhydrolase [Phycisphaerae bacterium]
MKTTFTCALLLPALLACASCSTCPQISYPHWARGIENQRKADLGNGKYLNPILPGDHPDPSIFKEGDDYYLTNSSFETYPGLLIWHSRDLVNWEPVGPALRKYVGSVWAPDLTKFHGKYYIYFPGVGRDGKKDNYVVTADNIKGPWSDPIDLHLGQIDPGHAVSADGHRFLFLSGGYMVPLAPDGLSTSGPMQKVYNGWPIPDDWIIEGFAQEGPKIMHHGDYYYMTLAEGGTAGPPTGHMVISARAKSLEGPWENSPYNPIIRAKDRDDTWWSRGHGTPVEGPGGQWYLVYHAYEKNFYTLGRQTLLEPIVWTNDGWFKSAGYDVAKPIPKPKGEAVPNGFALSDDFSTNKMGLEWGFYKGDASDAHRYRYVNHALVIKGKGDSPANCSPLTCTAGDQAYQVEVEIHVDDHTRAGLLLFYDDHLYAGLGFDKDHFIMHRYGTERVARRESASSSLHIRIVNDRNIMTIYTSPDGTHWSHYPTSMDVSGYNHNTRGGFLALRPALYSAGTGQATFKNFQYHALP